MKKNDKKTVRQKNILKTAVLGASKSILIALFVGTALVAPGGIAASLQILSEVFEGKDSPEYEPKQIQRALEYLRSKKLIDIQRKYQKEVFSLTKIGYFRARKLARSFGIEKPKKWDGKWRIVIFDVPEEKKSRRETFREALKNLGLANIQKSIWIHPYECSDQISSLAGTLLIKPYIRYIVADKITGERDLRSRFGI